jgi:FKBP-type peptidyl-prolyl cis-trans isomerase FkpA
MGTWRPLVATLGALATTIACAAPGGGERTTTNSGLVYESVKEGSGARPTASDVVRVHYRGTFPDGREFDSSYGRGEPAEFPLNRVIPCWTEGVQRMKVGGKAKLTCPPAAGGGLIPPNATLHFDVELLSIAAGR